MYLDTVLSEMMKPSFVSSAWIRGRTPSVLCHQPDESTDLGIHSGPSRMAPPRDFRPVPSESFPLPPSDRIGVNDNQAACPCRPRAPQRDPERSVRVIERRPGPFLVERCHLLPQNEVFNHEVGAPPTHRADRTGAERDEEYENTEHGAAECGSFPDRNLKPEILPPAGATAVRKYLISNSDGY